MSKNQLQEVTIYQALYSQELFSFSIIHYSLRYIYTLNCALRTRLILTQHHILS